jgi:AAA15 family ATPase/GTPase
MLIDEVENGLHYSVLRHVWPLLMSFSRKFNVQVFVSTHSRECLRSLLPTLQENEDEFSLLQPRRGEAGHEVRQNEGPVLTSALLEDFEIRA